MARPTNVDRLLAHSLAHIFKSVRCYGFFHYLCLSSFYGLIAYSRPLYKKGIRLHIIVRNAHAHSESECCENSLSRIPFLKWYDGGAFKGMYTPTHTYLLIVDDGHQFHWQWIHTTAKAVPFAGGFFNLHYFDTITVIITGT